MMKRIVKLTDRPVRTGSRYEAEFVNIKARLEAAEHAGHRNATADVAAVRSHPQSAHRAVPVPDLLSHEMVSDPGTTTPPAGIRQAFVEPSGIADDQNRAAVDLYWLPLGAGGRSVRINGRVFEFFCASVQRRDLCDLYHSALEVQLGPSRYVIEMAPVWNEPIKERGVVAEGAVGHRKAGRFRLFRYEIRRWRDGRIPDVDEAVDSPCRLTSDPACARRILDLVPHVPTAVWGRDDLNTGDMWNSNSLISWLIARSGIETTSIDPPAGGRAPGWQAGLVLAARQINSAAAETETNAHLTSNFQSDDAAVASTFQQRPPSGRAA